MDRYLQQYGYVTARFMLAAIFLLTGYDKLVDVEDAARRHRRDRPAVPDAAGGRGWARGDRVRRLPSPWAGGPSGLRRG